MVKRTLIVFTAFICLSMVACRAKKGCPTNGKNVGAEKLLGADKATMKAVKKASKFKS